MRVQCSSCSATLNIPDNRVAPGKTLKVTCPKCKGSTLVKGPPAAPAPRTDMAEAEATVAVDLKAMQQLLQESAPTPAAPSPAVESGTDDATANVDMRQMEGLLAEAAEDAPVKPLTGSRPVMSAPIVVEKISPKRSAPPPPPSDAEPEWFFAQPGGQQQGPVTLGDLERSARSGKIGPATLVWKEGMPNWVAASTLAEIRHLVSPPPTPGGPPPVPAGKKASAFQEFDTGMFDRAARQAADDASRGSVKKAGDFREFDFADESDDSPEEEIGPPLPAPPLPLIPSEASAQGAGPSRGAPPQPWSQPVAASGPPPVMDPLLTMPVGAEAGGLTGAHPVEVHEAKLAAAAAAVMARKTTGPIAVKPPPSITVADAPDRTKLWIALAVAGGLVLMGLGFGLAVALR